MAMNRKEFEEGIILGLVCPPVPRVIKREPIAYSYNGVRMPAIPNEIAASEPIPIYE